MTNKDSLQNTLELNRFFSGSKAAVHKQPVSGVAVTATWPYPPYPQPPTVQGPEAVLTEDLRKQIEKMVSKPVNPNVAVKFDDDKLDWTLLPYDALEDVVKVLEFGAKKYARDNWRNGKGLGISRVTKSTMRHLVAYLRGEKLDPETGLSHWAHIGCNVLFVLYYLKHPDKYSNE